MLYVATNVQYSSSKDAYFKATVENKGCTGLIDAYMDYLKCFIMNLLISTTMVQ